MKKFAVFLAFLLLFAAIAGADPGGKAAAETDIPFDAVTDFYYTYEASTYPPYFQRYRFYTEDGKYYFHHETREGDSWPLTEADATETGTAELTGAEWEGFLDLIRGGTARERREMTESGDAGPWLFIYWTGGAEEGLEFSFESPEKARAFEAFCTELKEGAGALPEQGGPFTVNGGLTIDRSALPYQSADAPATVYFFSEITPEALVRAYEATGVALPGRVGVKMSTGESEKSNFLRPELIAGLVRLVNGTIVECNTAYGGNRASTAMHRQQAKDNGLLEIAELDILDEEGSMEIPVEGGRRITVDYVGSHFADYDSFLVLSHFKGHAMAGFGGAIKNISIGFGSSMGKVWIHSGGTRTSGSIMGDTDAFLEAMADAAKGVDRYMDGRIVYISVLNRLSVDCDCDGSPAEPDMHDIGILASTDPLAIDQAAIDLVYAMPDSGSLIRRIESRNGLHTLEAGQETGLGSRYYRLIVPGE